MNIYIVKVRVLHQEHEEESYQEDLVYADSEGERVNNVNLDCWLNYQEQRDLAEALHLCLEIMKQAEKRRLSVEAAAERKVTNESDEVPF